MPRRTPAPLPLLAAACVALLMAGVVPLAVSGGLPGMGRAAAEDRPLRPGPAYWLAAGDGGVFAYGRAAFAGAASGARLNRGAVAIAATPSGDGYWVAAGDGGVFAYGDAPWLGGVAGAPLNTGVVDVAATPTGRGYWLVGADGGVFAFGDAPWLGGVAGTPLRSPVTAIAGTPTGRGYWVVAGDGGVFAFGDAPWLGAPTDVDLRRAVVDVAPTPSGRGYRLAAADGGVFAYGDAGYHGSALGQAGNGSVVGIASAPAGDGYWLAAADGGVFSYGAAGFYGSAADSSIRRPVVGIASGIGTTVASTAPGLSSTFGWDISWPQCGRPFPGGHAGYAIVGVTDGHLWDVNPCLAHQHRWSTQGGTLGGLYVNVNWPSRAAEPHVPARMAEHCALDDLGCQMYQWGYQGVSHAVAEATARDVSAPMWWLDVETANRWSGDKAMNARVVQGAIDALRRHGIEVGVYSTSYQWGVIVGDFAPGLPNWVAGPGNVDQAAAACRQGPSFGGGVPWMVQYPHQGFDGNLMCEAGMAHALASFKVPPPPPVPELALARRSTIQLHRME